jgi:hypothetical protein
MTQTGYIARLMIATLACAWRECGHSEDHGAMHQASNGKAYFICYRHCAT